MPSSRFCSSCGLTLGQLRRHSTVGCGVCYEAFRDVLSCGIQQLQGATVHGQVLPRHRLDAVRRGSSSDSGSELPRGSDWLESLLGLERLEWLDGSGVDADVVVSSRLRLARNLSRHRFPGRASAETLQQVRNEAVSAARTRLPQWVVLGLSQLSGTEAALLRERHLLSTDPAPGRELVALKGAACSLLINEEDHVRLQALRSGRCLTRSLASLIEVAADLEAALGFATSAELGYLTACPSNLGTGLRASVLLHLPALAWFEALPEVARKVANVGEMTLRGLHGEESSPQGAFMQLSNQVTLGRSEEDLVEKVESVARSLIEWERAARENLLDSRRLEVEDAVWRAWGSLCHARLMSREEAVEALGLVRFGELLGLLSEPSAMRLLVASGDAHVEWRAGSSLSARQTDSLRAAILREALS